MDKPLQQGTWLVIDAAGPVTVVGLISCGDWVTHEAMESDFIEGLQRQVEVILARSGRKLPELAGCLYACGPGSTLGLRLAAMFLRGLMELPPMRHWQCFQYHNLALALADRAESLLNRRQAAVAPWRKDRLHHTIMETGPSPSFHHDGITPQKAAEMQLPGVVLGRRPRNAHAGLQWQPYPHERIPATLERFPELLEAVSAPAPYAAEEPEFARWSPQRHSAS